MSKYETPEMIETIKTVITNSSSMAEACSKTSLHRNTFTRIAKKYGLYKPNQGRKGSPRPKYEGKGKYPLKDIFNGKYPQYQTYKLRNRLIQENIKQNKCECCGIDKWNNKPIQCELDHIDGNSNNHALDNLRMLCPNCHSQTETFRAKNIK